MHVCLAMIGGSHTAVSHWLSLFPLLGLSCCLISMWFQSVPCCCSWFTDQVSDCCHPPPSLLQVCLPRSLFGVVRLWFYWLSMSASDLFFIDRPEGILAPLHCEWLFTNTFVHYGFVFSNFARHSQMEVEGLDPRTERRMLLSFATYITRLRYYYLPGP